MAIIAKDYQLLIFDWEGTLMAPDRTLFPGIKEMLINSKNDYLLAVATNRFRCSLDRLLKETDLEHIFAMTRCADEAQSKPHPQMLQDILIGLNVNVASALMIGDSESDVVMASYIGMDSVVIDYTAQRKEAFVAYRPLHYVTSVDALQRVIFANKACPDR